VDDSHFWESLTYSPSLSGEQRDGCGVGAANAQNMRYTCYSGRLTYDAWGKLAPTLDRRPIENEAVILKADSMDTGSSAQSRE